MSNAQAAYVKMPCGHVVAMTPRAKSIVGEMACVTQTHSTEQCMEISEKPVTPGNAMSPQVAVPLSSLNFA